MTELRSPKQQRAYLVRSLRAAGGSWVEIADVLSQRYRLNARVALRYAHGWSQRRAADEWNQRWPDELKTFKNFSYWETWPGTSGHAPCFDNLSKLAQLYECAVSDLLVDLPDFRHLDATTGTPGGLPGERPLILGRADATLRTDHDVAALDNNVDRRSFTEMTAGLLTSAVIPHFQVPARVDAGHIRQLQAAVEQLDIQDQVRGGGAILRPALRQFTRARRMVDESDYTETIGRQLLTVVSSLGIRAGWAAFDRGDHQLAQFLYSEAQPLAASSGNIEAQAHVWAHMSIQCTHLADAHGDMGLARAGLRFARLAADVASYEPSPRLHAWIALREAAAHAQIGDAGAFRTAITQARRELDRGPHPADPPWCRFAIEPEITGHEARGLLRLGCSDRSIMLFESVLDDDGLTRRNRICWEASFASALLDAGDRAQALARSRIIVPALATGWLTSSRPLARLRHVRLAAEEVGDEEFCLLYDTARRTPTN